MSGAALSGVLPVRTIREAAVPDSRGAGIGMVVALCFVHDMPNVDSRGFKIVGNKRPVAAPPEQLGAHDRRVLKARHLQQPLDCGAELTAFHIVGVTPEGEVAPDRVACLW